MDIEQQKLIETALDYVRCGIGGNHSRESFSERMDEIYTPFKQLIDQLIAENARLQAIIDEANAQEPCFEVGRHGKSGEYFAEINTSSNLKLYKGMKLYAAPIPAQQSPAVAVPDEETNFCALKSITDSQVNAVARAFWRRIYAYRNDYDIELPKPLPVEFMAHMATALTWVDKEPCQCITEQDAREMYEVIRDIVQNYECGDKVDSMLRPLLEKLNK